MSFLPYRTGAIFFPLKNHNNFAAEAAFLCKKTDKYRKKRSGAIAPLLAMVLNTYLFSESPS